ncbi:hypothetical protein [Lactiplantibacillus paraxiangfangensis]|uniref:hypothetical protein n=1 Tax=Lactiplantibacillus paraxiangfangensis TaxID=3076224 RepID=UPI0030C75FAC
MNWGTQLVKLAANHAYVPEAFNWTKQRMKQHLSTGGSAQDDVCAHEYKLFAIEVLITEYQRNGLDFDLSKCWDKPADYFVDLDQARNGLQMEA